MLGGDSGRRRLLGDRPVGGRLLLRHPGWLGSGALVKGGRREVGTGRLGFMGEALGGVAERPDEVLEALPDGRGIVEPGDDGLRLGDQLIAQLRDPALSLGHQAVGVAACVLPVASRLGLGLVAKPGGLALDRIEDRADAPRDLRRHRGHRSVGTRGGPRLPWQVFPLRSSGGMAVRRPASLTLADPPWPFRKPRRAADPLCKQGGCPRVARLSHGGPIWPRPGDRIHDFGRSRAGSD